MIKLNGVEIKLDKYPDGTFLLRIFLLLADGTEIILNGSLNQWKN